MNYSRSKGNGFKDETGNRYGRLTVISFSHSRPVGNGMMAMWNCRCDCGSEKIVGGTSLRIGETASCGCLRRDMVCEGNSKHGLAKRTAKHPLYHLWKGMRARCKNPNHSHYHRYGGRGIKVCERWREFDNFLHDMGERPSPAHSIDRINNNGDYEPSNCHWATPIEQSRNGSRMRRVIIGGVEQLLADVCLAHGTSCRIVASRLRRGWTLGKALSTPKKQ